MDDEEEREFKLVPEGDLLKLVTAGGAFQDEVGFALS
jgi:hypothetical protein